MEGWAQVMRLRGKLTPYSSIVGGGIMLTDHMGRATFQIVLIGTTKGITKEQNDSLCQQLQDLINKDGLEVEL